MDIERPERADASTTSRSFWGHPFFHTSRWPMLAITAGVVVVGSGIAAGVTWLLGRIVFGALSPQEWLVPGAASGEEGWLAPIKVALTVAAGVGAAVALVVAYRKQRLAERTESRDIAATRRAENAEQREVSRAYQDRYARAAEQMGSANPTVRLAGVYALANLADEWGEQRQQCVEVLCAHMRLPWNPDESELATVQIETPEAGGTRTTTYAATPGELEVRKTILRIIGDHLLPREDLAAGHASWSFPLDFQGATLPDIWWHGRIIPDVNFSGATFSGDAQFSGATFSGATQFWEATFSGGAWFRGATFSGPVWFEGATFSGHVGFAGATFSGGAWFRGATFSGPVGFEGATFSGPVVFIGATFSGDAWFAGATFSGDAWFGEATFSKDAWFVKTRFGSAVELPESLRDAVASGVTFAVEPIWSRDVVGQVPDPALDDHEGPAENVVEP